MTADIDQIAADYLQAVERGESPDPAEWVARHPGHAAELAAFFTDLGVFAGFLGLSTDHDATTDYRPAGDPPAAERFGEYELVSEIGRGAMGVVHRARVAGTHLVVALKQVQPGGLDGGEAVRRFREEVETVSALRHPNIIPIYHYGEQNGRPFFTMALVEGGSLDQHMARLRADRRAAVALVAKIARAVHHAHQRQVLHRDLKPSNVMLDEAGEPHVADFGLATKLSVSGAATAQGPAGSLPWMAPEAVRGDPTLTTAIDVWALGVILYELLAGRRPFPGKTRDEIRRWILDGEPVSPRIHEPKVDRDLEAVCLRCLSKDPDKRYESASALALDLERWLRDEPVRARRARRAERAARWVRRNPVVAGGLVVLAAVIVAGAVAGFSVARDMEGQVRQEVCRGNEFAARHVASTLMGRLQEVGTPVLAAADRPALHDACRRKDWGATAEHIRPLIKADRAEFATVFVLDPDGVIRAEWPQSNRVIGQNFRHRDYFRGAVARADRTGRDRVHLSRVFQSRNDYLDKLAVSVPFRLPNGDGRVWVLGATLPTDTDLGVGGLHDDRRKAVLLAPREDTAPPEYVILVHPGYTPREPTVAVPAAFLVPAPDTGFAATDDYRDPMAATHPEFAGRWLTGFAPVPGTELVVLVQQRDEEAIDPHRTFFRRSIEWGVATVAVAGLLGLGLWLWRGRLRPASS
jgi:tRNA A-37 threonylcarbamoyl transferase component Bud32